MSRVILVNPGRNKKWAANFAPIHLGYMASYLEKHGVSVQIVDELAGQSVEEVFERFANGSPGASVAATHASPVPSIEAGHAPRLQSDIIVGITATTPVAPDAYRVAKLSKKYGFLTVMGGRHPMILQEEALKYADSLVIGEGEQAMLEIAQGRRDKIIQASYIKNLDDLPPPAWHLMDMEFYLRTTDRNPRTQLYFLPKGTRAGSYLSIRGCPYNCVFCYNIWRKTPVRYHSARRVVDDLRHLVDRYGMTAVYFYDDDFFVFKKRLHEFCQLMIKEGLNHILWGCQATANHVDLESLKLAKEAGCRQVGFGFESGSQRILDILKQKRQTVKRNAEAIKLCREAGVLSFGNYMIGSPTETLEDVRKTREFMKANPTDGTSVFVATPYPGTGLWEWCKERGKVTDDIDWERFSQDQLAIPACDTIPPETIQRLKDEMQFEFFHPRGIREWIRVLRSSSGWLYKIWHQPQRVLYVLRSVLLGPFSLRQSSFLAKLLSMRLDSTGLEILSELFINLAAGWLGAIFIVPNFSRIEFPFGFFILTADLIAIIFSLMIAFRLRKLSKGEL